MANPMTGSKYDAAATDAILKRKYGTANPLPTNPLLRMAGNAGKSVEGGGFGMIKDAYGNIGQAGLGVANVANTLALGQNAPAPYQIAPTQQSVQSPSPATKSISGIPSGWLQNQVQSVGNAALPKTLTDTQGTFENPMPYQQPSSKEVVAGLVNKYGKPTATTAPNASLVGGMSPQQARIKAYQDFMTGSQQRGNEAMARWKAAEGPRMASSKDREQFARSQQTQAQQNEQANIAGEREAGTERFKAEQAARGMIGAKEAASSGETAGIKLKGEYDVKAAEAKATATEGKDRAKMLKDFSMTLANSEPGSPAYQAAESGLAELYGQKQAGGVQEGATATGKDGKKIKYVGGKWVSA